MRYMLLLILLYAEATCSHSQEISITGPEYVETEDELKLVCNATNLNEAPDSIAWFKDGKRIAIRRKRINVIESSNSRTISSALIISKAVMTDTGTYVCRSSDLQIRNVAVTIINRFRAEKTEDITTGAEIPPGNWNGCQNVNEGPARSRTDTTERVRGLRELMLQQNIGAYIISSTDAHLSEFISDHDKRLQFISGFTGSAGTAVVTLTSAALWTDGRYFLQAEAELGCDWILMRQGEPGVPTIPAWIVHQLEGNNRENACACQLYFDIVKWEEYRRELDEGRVMLVGKMTDLVELVWEDERPPLPSTIINALPLKYAGVSWQEKMKAVFDQMEQHNADILAITALDETAWLFNLRATDIMGFVNDPFFYSMACITREHRKVTLFIHDKERKLSADPTDPSTTMALHEHLNTNPSGSCTSRVNLCVEVQEYNIADIVRHIGDSAARSSVNKVWLSYHANQAIYRSISRKKVFLSNTPVAMMKARKNSVEVQGMRNAHIRDAAALARFMAKLEREVDFGNWTEVTGMAELGRYRSLQELSRGDSFAAISSVGPHAAVNHYFASNATDRQITTHETYLLDSGGQYLDGTTDITRTFLFRDPTDFERECYTRVLMGQINLAMAKWSSGKYGREIDAFARQPLWEVGLDYRHGTGHGIGAYLSVHEGPGRISNYHKKFVWDVPLEENMFFSNEPGYYEDGKFGIRLENIVRVSNVETKYTFPGVTMLGMETVSLFPYEPHMIDLSIMTKQQIDWLSNYNERVIKTIGPLLKEQGDDDAYEWLKRRTDAIARQTRSVATLTRASQKIITCLVLLILSLA